jgi:hypothetical protein
VGGPVDNTFPAAAGVRTDTAVDRSTRLVGGTDPVDTAEGDRQDRHHDTVAHTRDLGIAVAGLALAERDSTKIRIDSTIGDKLTILSAVAMFKIREGAERRA